MTETDLDKLVSVLRRRQSCVEILVDVAESVSKTLDEGLMVTDNQRDALRKSIEAVKSSRLVGS